jgi:biotin carboxyl carrier protein
MKYITTVGDEEFIIEIDRDDQILVNGQKYEIDFQPSPEGNVYSLLLDNHSFEGVAEERAEERGQTWDVLMKGELYRVEVQDERAYRLAKARESITAVTGEVTIASPMPGIIVAVPVSEGEQVSKGDKVVILESMKMENELRAPRDGIISRVSVKEGASVEKGQILAVISDPDASSGK